MTTNTALTTGQQVIVNTAIGVEQGIVLSISKPFPGEQQSVRVQFADGTNTYFRASAVRAI